jgi:hypothetical protein
LGAPLFADFSWERRRNELVVADSCWRLGKILDLMQIYRAELCLFFHIEFEIIYLLLLSLY